MTATPAGQALPRKRLSDARRTSAPMGGIRIDAESSLTLQAQLRGELVRLIHAGDIRPGARLPSSRKLAARLKVSRNTVAMAYQQLIAEGLIVGRERSGIFVHSDLRLDGIGLSGLTARVEGAASRLSWKGRIKRPLSHPTGFRCPRDWLRYPYPFIDGRFDASLYLINEWREAARLALGVGEILVSSVDSGEADDAFLIEEIRTKILPRRGIQARPEEILITAGAQHAMFSIAQILVGADTVAGVENPGSPDLRELLRRQGAALVLQPVDACGLVVDPRLEQCDIVFATPGRQSPTAATLSNDRRRALFAMAQQRDMLIVEDDVDYETSYASSPQPALKSLDTDGRVIYVSSLSKMFGPALRLGFMVAAPELIEEVRKLRRLVMRHPPLHNQRTAAHFLSLGHYDANMFRISRICRERAAALVDALDYYLPHVVALNASPGSTSFLIRGPSGLNVQHLASEAAKRGVLIEPADAYFADSEEPQNVFRMGVTSIPVEKIRAGVQTLAAVVRDLTLDDIETLEDAPGEWLRGNALRESLNNATYLCRTVHGEPYSIQLLGDGTLVGQAGHSNEDCDVGEWWIEEDRWFRQWRRWSYGEVQSFTVVMDQDQIKWFNAAGRLVDRAIVAPAGPAAEGDQGQAL